MWLRFSNGSSSAVAVTRVGESTGQTQFPISLNLAKDPTAEIATWC